jgi:hypothetical protein
MHFCMKMKSLLPHSLLLMVLCLPFSACTTPQLASAGKAQDEGDTFTGTVIESSPERITIKLKDSPQLLVIEGNGGPAMNGAAQVAKR